MCCSRHIIICVIFDGWDISTGELASPINYNSYQLPASLLSTLTSREWDVLNIFHRFVGLWCHRLPARLKTRGRILIQTKLLKTTHKVLNGFPQTLVILAQQGAGWVGLYQAYRLHTLTHTCSYRICNFQPAVGETTAQVGQKVGCWRQVSLRGEWIWSVWPTDTQVYNRRGSGPDEKT